MNIDKFARLDALCTARSQVFASLNPEREKPWSYVDNLLRLVGNEPWPSPSFLDALYTSSLAIIEATLTHFPENIFWDFDGLFAALFRSTSADQVQQTATTVVQLFAGYGINSVICFRYTHDFIYGFDWARWVGKDPENRSSVGAYDPPFLAYLVQRRRELEALIAQDDAKYGKLPSGEPRNPYAFNRTPEHEERRLRELALKDEIPFKAWLF